MKKLVERLKSNTEIRAPTKDGIDMSAPTEEHNQNLGATQPSIPRPMFLPEPCLVLSHNPSLPPEFQVRHNHWPVLCRCREGSVALHDKVNCQTQLVEPLLPSVDDGPS